ncbi:MAG: hypothetical protein RJB60_1127, partial [Pseudomonadota bacterium]
MQKQPEILPAVAQGSRYAPARRRSGLDRP